LTIGERCNIKKLYSWVAACCSQSFSSIRRLACVIMNMRPWNIWTCMSISK